MAGRDEVNLLKLLGPSNALLSSFAESRQGFGVLVDGPDSEAGGGKARRKYLPFHDILLIGNGRRGGAFVSL